MAATTPQRRSSQREMVKEVSKKTNKSKNVGTKSTATSTSTTIANNNNKKSTTTAQELITQEHLPPLSLVLTVLICSGFMLMFALRDFMSTGRIIFGNVDEKMMQWTKSMDWFNDGKNGWKSKAGGFSAIQSISTDYNNMGGFFIRKMSGATSTALCLHKLIPLLGLLIHHPTNNGAAAIWKNGHYIPLLYTAIIANISIIIFLIMYYQEFHYANILQLPMIQMIALAVETIVIVYHLIVFKLSSSTTSTVTTKSTKDTPAVALNLNGIIKSPNSPPSRIVARTVCMVSTFIVIIAGRDLFFPGYILPFIPRDDIYLEWTNALLHSPPPGSPEHLEYGMISPLYIGDLYMSQYMALHLLLLCLYKFVTAIFIKHGNNGYDGQIQARMIWQCSTISNCMILFLLRLFSNAASSASLDLRYHLMAFGYETFILGLYGFF